MSAAFSPSFMVMQRPSGSTTAFSIDSSIGGPPQPSPGHFVYTGYPMFMPYRSVVSQPPPPPPPASQQPSPGGHHPQMPSSQSGFCSGSAQGSTQGSTQGMALTSTLMASSPGGFSPSQQHQEAARKFGSQASHAVFEKTQELRSEAEDGKGFSPGKESASPAFHDADTPSQTSTARAHSKEDSREEDGGRKEESFSMDSDSDYSSDDNLTSMCHKEDGDGGGSDDAPHLHGSSSGGGGGAVGGGSGKNRRRRTAFTSEQSSESEKEFHCKKYSSSTERSQIAHALKSSEVQVKIWFQNRRAKWKRVKAGNVNNKSGEPSRNPKIVVPIPVHVSRFAIRSQHQQMEQARP